MDPPLPPWKFFEDVAQSGYGELQSILPASPDVPIAGLLTLPPELRDLIYDYFLEINHPVPPSPPFVGKRKYRRARNDTDQRMRDIEYVRSLPRDPLQILLHTCRTVRMEVLDILIRRNKSGQVVKGEVDIMAKGFILIPTWTRLPALPSRAAPWDLTVNLRIFSPEAFQSSDGWPRNPGFVFRDLLLLLNQFRTCGPSFTTGQPEQAPDDCRLRIRTLVIKMSNLDIYTPRMFQPAVYETVRMCKALALRGDARNMIETIKIVVEDQDLRVPGLQGKSWNFEVSDVRDDDQIAAWAETGFYFRPEVANFTTGNVT